jgi:hypothetical protein
MFDEAVLKRLRKIAGLFEGATTKGERSATARRIVERIAEARTKLYQRLRLRP